MKEMDHKVKAKVKKDSTRTLIKATILTQQRHQIQELNSLLVHFYPFLYLVDVLVLLGIWE